MNEYTNHIKALKTVSENLKKIDWVLIGSLNLYIQGISVEPHDIDLLLNSKRDAFSAAEILKEFEKEPLFYKEKEIYKSYYGVYEIEGVQVELIGEIQHRLSSGIWTENARIERKNVNIINFQGMKIPCCPLEIEYQAYSNMRRIEKAEKIKEAIEKKR